MRIARYVSHLYRKHTERLAGTARPSLPHHGDRQRLSVTHVELLRLLHQRVQSLKALAPEGLPIGFILNDAALLNNVGEARLTQRQQTIFQHCGVIIFQRLQRFTCRNELQLAVGGDEVIDLVAGHIFLDEKH